MDIHTVFTTESSSIKSASSSSKLSQKRITTTASPLFAFPLFTLFFHFLRTLTEFYHATTSSSQQGSSKDESNGGEFDDGTIASSFASNSKNNQDLEIALDDAFEDQKELSSDIDDLGKRIERLEERRKNRLQNGGIDDLEEV